jgi:hypothetical protein
MEDVLDLYAEEPDPKRPMLAGAEPVQGFLALGTARLASSPRRPAKPAMTVGLGTELIVPAGVAGDVPAGRVLDEAELVTVERADCVVDHVADLAGRSHNPHE